MKKKISFRKNSFLAILIVFLCVFVLSSCGSKYGQKNAYLEASAAESSGGCGGGSTFAIKSDWLIEQIENGVDSAVNDYFEYIESSTEYDEAFCQNRESPASHFGGRRDVCILTVNAHSAFTFSAGFSVTSCEPAMP